MEHTESSTNVRFTSIAPHFVVPDVVQAAEYYRDVLGFTILDYFAKPPVFAMVRRTGVEIHFGKANPASAMPILTNRKVGFDAYIWVNDTDALHQELKSSGANIIEGPVDRVYGRREVLILDCFGYKIAFGS